MEMGGEQKFMGPITITTTTSSVAGTPLQQQQQQQQQQQLNIPTSFSSEDESTSVLLGVQALERQQEQLEEKRRQVGRINPFDNPDIPTTVLLDDDVTLPSDTTASSTFQKYNHPIEPPNKKTRSLRKSLLTPLKSTGSKLRNSFSMEHLSGNSKHGLSEEETNKNKMEDKSMLQCKDEEYVWEPHEVKPMIQGYLLKWGRNGQWQRRWFECDGAHLSYFKHRQRNKKLLATLDLSKVGMIGLDQSDPAELCFAIQVAKRHYKLCAENSARAKDWVISLNRAKEARMNTGNLSLVVPYNNRQRQESDGAQPVVQLTTQRQRLKGYTNEDMDPEILRQINPSASPVAAPAEESFAITTIPAEPHTRPHFIPLTGWTKQGRSSLQRMSMRLSRWATRMTRLRCVVKEPVFFPHDLHSQQPFENEPESQAGEKRPRAVSDVDEHTDFYIKDPLEEAVQSVVSKDSSKAKSLDGNESDDESYVRPARMLS